MKSKFRVTKTNAGVSLGLAMMSFCSMANDSTPAQDKNTDNKVFEEIVVTAQKRVQNVQDIPIAISAFGADQLRDRGIDDFSKLATLTPGLNLTPSTGFFDPIVTIRGIGLRFEEPNVSASAAVHIDEVAMATPTYLNFPVFDIERVEILKGPQGTLFGQNTTAGAINFISKKASQDLDGYVDYSYGRFNESDLEAAIGGGLSDNLAARLAIKYTKSDGYQHNIGTERTAGFTRVPGLIPGIEPVAADDSFGGQDKFAARLNLLLDISDDLSIQTTLRYFQDQSEVPMVKLEGTDALGMTPTSDDPHTVEGNNPNNNDHQQWGAQIKLDWDLGFATFTSLTGYENLERKQSTSEGSATRIIDQDLENESHLFSQEFRLVGTSDIANWTLGANYNEDQVDFFKRQNTLDLILGYLDTQYVRDVEGWAVFGQVDWFINEQLNITTGVRYLEEERAIDRSSKDYNLYGISAVDRLFPDIPIISADNIDADEVTWRLSLDYTPAESTLLYASISKGFKSGGFDGSAITSLAALEPFDGEELISYEAGFKWTGQELPLRINGSTFFYDYDNLQAQTLVTIVGEDNTGTVQDAILANAGAAEIKGAELDLNWRLTDELTLTAGVTYLTSEIVDFDSEDPDAVKATEGNDTPNTPEWQTSLQLTYETEISSDYFARASIDYSSIDDVYADIDNTESLVIEGFKMVNGRFEISPTEADWSVGIWVRNLTDETYFTSVAPAFTAPNGFIKTYALPRTYGIDFRYNLY